MYKILYIDACPRKDSRTRRLADALSAKLEGQVERLVLKDEDLPSLDDQLLEKRSTDCHRKDFTAPMYRFAKQFAEADEIVIAAPFWDMSFPAVLKKYIETICVKGISFRYSEVGVPVGLCKAKKLHYVTTSGGPTFGNDFGFGYIKTMAQVMFGISEVTITSLENLDIDGSDAEEMLRQAISNMNK